MDGKQVGKVYWIPEAAFEGIVAGWRELDPEASLEALGDDQWVPRARRHQHEVR